jgi:DNA-directed RNA polymerase specialized sigma24 family protein
MGADPSSRFVEIYESAYEPILGYVLRRCPHSEDAADVVAETFTTAWRRIEELPRATRRAVALRRGAPGARQPPAPRAALKA